MRRCWILLSVLAALPLPSAHATLIAIPATADNTLFESQTGNVSNGAGQYLFAGVTEGGLLRRGLIRFDIAATIPAGAEIRRVELALHMSRTPTASEVVSLHRVDADWGEGASRGFGQEGGGAPAAPGDATWQHTFYSTNSWSSPGGDFNPAASAALIVTGIGYYRWSNPAMIADVQSWLDQPAADFGWLLLGNEEGIGTAKRFDSREHADPQVRPLLTVDYVIPEPSSGCCLAGALLFGSRGRRFLQFVSSPFARRHLERR